MAVQPASGDADGEAPQTRLAKALDVCEAALAEPGDVHARIQAVAETLPALRAAAQAASKAAPDG
jgi:hypothetical protein